MTHEIIPIVHWIHNNIDKNSTLWNSFINNGNLPNLPDNTVYVTGSLEKIKEVNSVFDGIQTENTHTLLSDTNKLLNWMTICYIPPQKLTDYPVDRIVAFTNGRPEKWIRNLLKAKKVSGLVGWSNQIIDDWELAWESSYEDFTPNLLTQDYWLYKKSPNIQLERKVRVTVPQIEGLKNTLSTEDLDEKELNWKNELDNIATQLIHSIWIIGDYRMKDFAPILFQLVEDYLTNIRDIFAHESNIDRIESLFNEWIGGELTYVDEIGS